jgi:putative membrane protein
MRDWNSPNWNNPNLNNPWIKASYVAAVTTFCTFLGCWAVLAHQASAPPAQSAASDTQFAKKAAQGGMAEVKLGQLAQQKGTADSVKKFGARMVEDHSKAGDELKQAASQEKITLPTDISAKDKTTYDMLSKLSGAAFDRAYAKDMVRDHEEDVAEFNKEANSGHSPAIKDFATQTLPTLKDHLKEAKEMRQNVSATNPAASKNGSAGNPGKQ